MKSIVINFSKGLLIVGILSGKSVDASHNRRMIRFNDEQSFQVLDNDRIYTIEKTFLDKEIRNIDPKLVMTAHKHGLISLYPVKMNNGETVEFGMKSRVNGKGGGLFLAALFGGIVRAVGYGSLGATATHAVRTTFPQGDRNHPIVGGMSALGAGRIGGEIATRAGNGAAGPAGSVSTFIEGTGYSQEVAEIVVATGVGSVPIIVGIEMAANAAAAVGLWIPWF